MIVSPSNHTKQRSPVTTEAKCNNKGGMSQDHKEDGIEIAPGDEKGEGNPARSGGSNRSMSWNPRDMKILVVDDERTARMVSQRVLKKCGYNGIVHKEK